MSRITFEEAKEHFDCPPEEGVLVWKVYMNRQARVGDLVGKNTISHKGYRSCSIRKKKYQYAVAYDKAARKYFGEFATCNFDEGSNE